MSLGRKHFYDFADFRIDLDERVLLRGGKPVPLTPKAFHMLAILVENHGHIVDKEKLLSEVWADSFVEEGNLSVNARRLRKALSDDANKPIFIETIPRRGYRFIATVKESTHEEVGFPNGRSSAKDNGPVFVDDGLPPEPLSSRSRSIFYRSWILVLAGLLVIAASLVALNAGGLRDRLLGTADPEPIRTLAVLPLRSLNPENGDAYLGLGIADTIISKISQVGGLTVRPTSAVSKYADKEADSLEAARELRADAVLDGTFLRAGDRLRVSVNLLRVQDGSSLWAESFDVSFTDIFALQDQVSKQVTERLRLKLSAAEQSRLAKPTTTNAEAYSYYSKAMYHFSKRDFSGTSQEETETAIDLFRKAIELDGDYALAHAQLGFAYAWMADYKEGGPALIANAKEELRMAERIEPNLPEVHIARAFIAWSHFENWQIETAFREARLAAQLDPAVSNYLLASIYFHVGLEEQATKELDAALKQDPNSETIKFIYRSMYEGLAKPDEWLALNQRLFNRGPDARYYLEKRMLKEAEPLIAEASLSKPDSPEFRRDRALMFALQGKHREAQAAIPDILEKTRRYKGYHHTTYTIARIYALDGKSDEAVKWLRVTANEGFPCYPLFARDAFLDPVRKDPAFLQFLAEMKTLWEGYVREFG